MVLHAQEATEVARGFLARINEVILFPVITLLLAVALIVFLYGLFELVFSADSSDARNKGRKHILFGIIGMLVMLSALAILRIAAGTFGIDVPESGI